MEFPFLEQIAREYGTPIYVLDQAELDRCLLEIEEAFVTFPTPVRIAYPYKANSLKRICEYMAGRTQWAECSSGLEIDMAIRVGINPHNVVFNSPYKSDTDLEKALHCGCRINIDNQEELGRLHEIATALKCQAKIGIRISVPSKTKWDKFGFLLHNEANEVIRSMLKLPNIHLVGLHSHRSNISQLDSYDNYINTIFAFASYVSNNTDSKLEYIDIGSGFAVDYPAPLEEQNWKAPSMQQYAEVVRQAWYQTSLSNDISLVIEPGRRLVASCAMLLTKVVSIKHRPNGKVIIVDAGHNLMPGVDFYRYPISQAKAIHNSMDSESCDVHGCLCDSLDVLGTKTALFSPEVGEILVIGNVGGYDMSRSFFWQLPRVGVLWVSQVGVESARLGENLDYLWELSM